MTGNEIATIRPVPVPTALREVGVFVGQDTASGLAVVSIPAQVRERFNVLDPVQSFAQADPNWTPAIRVVELNPDKEGPHFYTNSSWRGKVAPTKPALELLAKAGGVLYTRTERVPRDQLNPGELFAYKATIGIRRSDGTIEEVSREKGYNEEAEREEIIDGVRRAKAWENGSPTNRPKFIEGTPDFDAEVRKRWLQEQRYAQGKTESKAILRAIRAAFQVPQQITPADAAKPWLVIGYSFTPDYDDAEIKRALVAAGLNAQAAIYGPGAGPARAALPAVNAETGEIHDDGTAWPDDDTEPAGQGDPPPAADAPQSGQDAPIGDTTRATGRDGDEEEPAPTPVGSSSEPADEPEPIIGAAAPSDDEIAAAGATLIPSGPNEGTPLGEADETWIRYALARRDFDAIRPQLETWAAARFPDTFAKYQARKAA